MRPEDWFWDTLVSKVRGDEAESAEMNEKK